MRPDYVLSPEELTELFDGLDSGLGNWPLPAVLDTACVRTGLHYQLRNGSPPASVTTARDGMVRLFMEYDTLTETLAHLPKFAASFGSSRRAPASSDSRAAGATAFEPCPATASDRAVRCPTDAQRCRTVGDAPAAVTSVRRPRSEYAATWRSKPCGSARDPRGLRRLAATHPSERLPSTSRQHRQAYGACRIDS